MRKKILSNSFVHTDDPIEQHIVNQLNRLRQQNKRLKDHINRTSAWTHMKEIYSWKPYDFYNYFCTKYREKYHKEFRLTGSVVRAYDRIDAFMKKNKISNEEYKTFIDKAFSRYFNVAITPVIGNLCSPSLFERLMGSSAKPSTTEDLFELDQVILNESKRFEEEIRENDIYGAF